MRIDVGQILLNRGCAESCTSEQEWLNEHGTPTSTPCVIFDESVQLLKAWDPDQQMFIVARTIVDIKLMGEK